MEYSKVPIGVTRKAIFLFLMVPSICLCFIYKYSLIINNRPTEIVYTFNTTNYILYSSKCRIPNIDPYNSEVKHMSKKTPYVPCSKLDLLTFVIKNKENTEAVLHVNKKLEKKYTKRGISCCTSEISRLTEKGKETQRDNKIIKTPCHDFVDNVTITNKTVIVRCRDAKSKKEVYTNAYSPITLYKEVEEKIASSDTFDSVRPLSLIFIGIDSISRLNMKRVMPETRSFLVDNNWLELQAYNKMADNTFPNLMAILTGMNSKEAYDKCKPKNLKGMDKCNNFLWYEFRKRGYVTAYAEDTPLIGTFNYNKLGFYNEPTDYYFRPYMIAAQELKTGVIDDMVYCAGPESFGERTFHTITDFATTFNNTAHFGFFWMNSFSHNKLNAPSRMDKKVRHLLETLKASGILETTAVFFISDHGMRFGDILKTHTGWMEERLPYFFIWMPQWFKETYPLEYENLRINTNRLTNPYDIYMTLQDILAYSGRNYSIKESRGCPKCKSLFKEVDYQRSCDDAGIPHHWCACSEYAIIPTSNSTVVKAGNVVLESIHDKINETSEGRNNCVKYTLKQIQSAWISDKTEDNYYLLLIIETVPYALFQGTVKINATATATNEDISRLDKYYKHSQCVEDSNVKLYCYCKK